MSVELLDFVKASLAEDEQLAWNWVKSNVDSPYQKPPRRRGDPRIYGPGNILDEVHSKRLTIALYEEAIATAAVFKAQGLDTSAYDVAAESYLNVIRLIAYAYRNRDGYQTAPEWMPGWIIELSG